MRSAALALLLGLGLIVASFFVWGYSWNYPEGACEEGEPCPTGDHIIQIVFPILFLAGVPLFVVALLRSLWRLWNDLRAGSCPGAKRPGFLGHGRKSDKATRSSRRRLSFGAREPL